MRVATPSQIEGKWFVTVYLDNVTGGSPPNGHYLGFIARGRLMSGEIVTVAGQHQIRLAAFHGFSGPWIRPSITLVLLDFPRHGSGVKQGGNPPPGGGGYEQTEEIREERSYKSGWRADHWAAGSGMNDGGRILGLPVGCYIKRRKT